MRWYTHWFPIKSTWSFRPFAHGIYCKEIHFIWFISCMANSLILKLFLKLFILIILSVTLDNLLILLPIIIIWIPSHKLICWLILVVVLCLLQLCEPLWPPWWWFLSGLSGRWFGFLFIAKICILFVWHFIQAIYWKIKFYFNCKIIN